MPVAQIRRADHDSALLDSPLFFQVRPAACMPCSLRAVRVHGHRCSTRGQVHAHRCSTGAFLAAPCCGVSACSCNPFSPPQCASFYTSRSMPWGILSSPRALLRALFRVQPCHARNPTSMRHQDYNYS